MAAAAGDGGRPEISRPLLSSVQYLLTLRHLQIEISWTENSLDYVFCQHISAVSVLTMDKCKHIGRLRLAQDHSILNPQKWHCVDCNTTESVWACLSCSHVACGRYIEEHALKHFQESSHPVALEVNELYVFCYLCDEYVLNDNATGDLKLLRSTLSAIKSQNYECTTRSGRTLRSMGTSDDSYLSHGGAQALLRNEDRMFTALWHRRRAFLGKIFRSWLELTPTGKKILEEERRREEAEERREKARKRRQERKRELKAEMEKMPPRKSSRLQNQIRMSSESAPCLQKTSQNMESVAELKKTYTSDEVRLKKISDSPIKRRPTVTPGVTGLRNLGNTCYMNSILQVLSHLLIFRECFLKLDLNQTQELLATATNGKTRSSSKHLSIAASTLHVNESQEKVKGSSSVRRPSLSSGLSGGASKSRNMELIQPREPSSKHISLCHELHTLFQVMWSGKWALVSPFAMLHSVWRLIPAFRGYAQQDAQEFLCELLDKVQQELETTGTRYPALIPASQRKLIKQVLNVVNNIFHGQLLSQVQLLIEVIHSHGSWKGGGPLEEDSNDVTQSSLSWLLEDCIANQHNVLPFQRRRATAFNLTFLNIECYCKLIVPCCIICIFQVDSLHFLTFYLCCLTACPFPSVTMDPLTERRNKFFLPVNFSLKKCAS
ncbi:ubiquitin carboxyl-terminal hydrolase 44 isoform X4 [Aquila chrysaetos chrysaetos]|uniref:ubiquitin carboxyl-terminal hydrolase 44 isoform X4 n=1 Tax=Aquila chrysaetos chrysaetos TaxID=223781 RepID=UPI001B7D3B64|nr:ubiquitin carboxyl-terminal hydrolase 44 isoform X4 [Aquila chrysaetos chrysaetos]